MHAMPKASIDRGIIFFAQSQIDIAATYSRLSRADARRPFHRRISFATKSHSELIFVAITRAEGHGATRLLCHALAEYDFAELDECPASLSADETDGDMLRAETP